MASLYFGLTWLLIREPTWVPGYRSHLSSIAQCLESLKEIHEPLWPGDKHRSYIDLWRTICQILRDQSHGVPSKFDHKSSCKFLLSKRFQLMDRLKLRYENRYTENDFEASKNLARYRSENNFVRPKFLHSSKKLKNFD